MTAGAERACIVFAGGGSGGHVFPGIAIAESVLRGARVEILFAGTPRGMENQLIPAHGYRLELLDVLPIRGRGSIGAAHGAWVAARAVLRSLVLLRRWRPKVVVSVGGYAAGPIALAASLLGVPLAVVEPNGVVGLANRILGPVARRAYVAWGPAATSFSPKKTRRLGVPLRKGFSPVPYLPSPPLRVLVLGGSQGAAPLNERLPEALGMVARAHPDLEILHQAGRDRQSAVALAYQKAALPAARVVAFLDDVAGELARADIIVARAGAGTVAEIAAVGRPALLVPLPHAADDHQTANARAFEDAGGAICLPQNQADAPRLAGELAALLGDPERRVRMSRASRAFGRPDAATEIARDLCALAGIPWRPERQGPKKTNGAARHTEAA
jgi:UDP-N-acetylglucosamine--N-acetylmuramyl-(pentapeptide) pyrophosphoryl-undecaprenol N-acetylglucosamine transferase